MLPDHVLSTRPIIAPFLFPKDIESNPVVDYELGGIGLNDTTEGLRYQPWKGRIKLGVNYVGSVMLSSANYPETVHYAADNLSSVSVTFDQNMNPAIAYMQGEEAKLRWYDTTIPAYDVITLPTGSKFPRVCLDDKRELQTAVSDIILAYTRGGKLYFREQRDRFLVEYELYDGVVLDLIMLGMNKVNRLQFQFGTVVYPPTFNINRATTAGRRRITTTGALRKVVGATYG
jgi:hypothetical protein